MSGIQTQKFVMRGWLEMSGIQTQKFVTRGWLEMSGIQTQIKTAVRLYKPASTELSGDVFSHERAHGCFKTVTFGKTQCFSSVGVKTTRPTRDDGF